ncbi:putative splicing factor 3b subunit 2 protein [Eutypa lata UCREL1]|uniref:Putative splicing factor 3b subunit 2 protein n=1 Tax=Eutypa lata (strain UCR-EL1) TaxID=1287681 RepID=M7TKF8_EUTLA|nr:putative splicing factor 3b subunit 2 protein [Eutypa lata UCREL1]
MAAPKMTKNQKRRAKKKADKQTKPDEGAKPDETTTPEPNEDGVPESDEPAKDATETNGTSGLEVKKDAATSDQAPADGPAIELEFGADDPAFSMYKDIFSKFGVSREGDDIAKEANAGNQGEVFFDDDNDDIPDEEDEASGQQKLSKKKRKMLNKLSIAELKALVKKPEVVEWHDTSSSDPRLLVQIKAQRNVVPVPSHWSLKREYLSSKRGIEKPAFKLPKFIADTGITEMRDAVLEKQAEQTLKQKQRERVQPKMGKLDIDYQKLYDAFFRFQDKPQLTRFGEVYYEGKEFETDLRHLRPGELSDPLKEALSIPPGAPPPWLINQQRFGPPPSYPSLRIPGLNAPIPAGAQWGFNPGCYGKPPVDEYNRPLFGGDIFGIMAQNQAAAPSGEPVERSLWGELQEPEEESEEEEEEDEDEDEDEEDGEGLQTPAGTETPAGGPGLASTVPTEYGGTQTESLAGELDLRKNRRGTETDDSAYAQRSAYTVVPERHARAEGLFGSDRVYDLKHAPGGGGDPNLRVLGSAQDEENASRKRKKPGDVDVALDPDALAGGDGGGLSKDQLRQRYEEGRRDEGPGAQWGRREEGLEEMIANESRKRLRRDDEKREERKKYRF